VSPDGDDDGPGTPTQPWRTVQKAANTLQAGETVIVKSGNYAERIIASISGTAENMIRYIAIGDVQIEGFQANGSYLEINGFTVTPVDCGSWRGAIDVSSSYCLIQNNSIANSTRQGIAVNNTSTSSVVRNNKIITANHQGMSVKGANHLIVGNEIADIRDNINGCSITSDVNAVGFFGSGHVFRGNYIHDFYISRQNGQPHMDAFQTFSALPNSTSAKNVVIERNHIFMGKTEHMTNFGLEFYFEEECTHRIEFYCIDGVMLLKSEY